MCSTGLNACNLGYRGQRTNQPSLSWQTWRTPEKLYKWYGDRVERGESCKPTEPATGEMIFSGPRFPQKSPQMGEGQFFPPLPQKMPILFHSGNKRQFKLCPKVFQTTKTNWWKQKSCSKKVTFLPDSTVYLKKYTVRITNLPGGYHRDLQTSGQSMCSNGRLAIENSIKI